MKQSNAGKGKSSNGMPTKVKEAVLAVILLGTGGTALAWGVGQVYRPAAAPVKPDDQCRMLANAFLAGDSELVFQHISEQDAKHLNFELRQLKTFQDKLLAPRLSDPIAWRPKHNRVISCQDADGVISLHMGDADGKNKAILSLFTKLEGDKITYRYDDLLRILSNLDKRSNLSEKQMLARVKSDAAAMAFAELPGFSQLHPGTEAEKIWNAEVERLAAAKALWDRKPEKPQYKRMAPTLID